MGCDEQIRICPRCKHDVAHGERQCPHCGLPSQVQVSTSFSFVRVLKLPALGIFVIPAGLFLMIVLAELGLKDSIERAGHPEGPPTVSASDESLASSAGCVADRVVISNEGPAHWSSVKIEVNRIYTFVADFISCGRDNALLRAHFHQFGRHQAESRNDCVQYH
jgi:hypothetical protein